MSGSAPARATAVALSYADQSKAPVVVAKGYGATAEAIMRTARESGVYVHESGELVGLLMQVNLDRQIPPALYLAVAEVMAWVARVDGRVARSITPPGASEASGGPG
ncbi:MAG: EscU/YscU/HrcU family type III secretion system export apparatus switch protein [Ramlibacter sp.]